ncbi:unnamed protein product [Nezara viridula]|uniref:Gustatory receptor n=1 Tax=Nezara viridula TaxID=85310 RepID=A0A9P0MTQ5_NEZVI|nr:unnamed protein product [Nezara viridula]
MKSSWTDRHSRLSLGLTFALSRIFGVFPLRLEDGVFVISWVGLFSSVLMTAGLVFSLVVHTLVSAPAVYVTPFTDMLNIAQQLGCDAAILASVCFVIRNRQVLSDVLNTLIEFEYAMFRLGVELKPLRYIWSKTTLLATWLAFGLDCYFLATHTYSSLFYSFSHYYIISLMVLINSQISWTAGHIASAFGCLSVALEGSGDLHQLVQWHRRLTVSCRMLSKVYSLGILILFGTALLSFTVEAFLTYKILQTQTLVYIAVCVYWTCILFSICFKIIASCVEAKNKGPAYRLYFHFQGSSGLTFDALGFFQIDWQLARTARGGGLPYYFKLNASRCLGNDLGAWCWCVPYDVKGCLARISWRLLVFAAEIDDGFSQGLSTVKHVWKHSRFWLLFGSADGASASALIIFPL